MALFRSERGIGRGETPESKIEAPFFVLFIICCVSALMVFHHFTGRSEVTAAMAVSMAVFGVTIFRVEFGVSCLVVAMLLSPEIDAGPVGYGERSLTLRYDDVLIIVIFIGVFVKNAYQGGRALIARNPVTPGIFAYLFVCTVSTADAFRASVPNFDKTAAIFVSLKMIEFYMVFFLVGAALRDLKQIRRQLVLFFLVAVAVNLYSLYSIGALHRLSAPFETGGTEPNTLGGYMVIIMCAAIGLFFFAPTRRLKLALFAVFLSSFYPFLHTLSRASYLAFLAAFLAIGILGRKYTLIGVMAAVILFSPLIMPEEVVERVNYTFQKGSGQQVVIAGVDTGLQVDKSTYERIYVWEKVKYNLRVWPWFGGGVSWGMILDSQYARVIIETGLFGLAAFIFMQYRMFRAARETYRWSADWTGIGLGLGAMGAFVGMLVHSLGTITFLIVRIAEPFWLLMALCAVARLEAIRYHAERRAQTKETEMKDSVPRGESGQTPLPGRIAPQQG